MGSEPRPATRCEQECEETIFGRRQAVLFATAWLTTATIFIPLIAAVVTLAFGVYNQNRQSRRDFELKVAEIVMGETGPVGAYNKARAFKAFFPDQLPPNFAAGFDPAEYESGFPQLEAEAKSKKEFINLIAPHPSERERILQAWRELFPGDRWTQYVTLGPRH
jgi:hypothetical protein